MEHGVSNQITFDLEDAREYAYTLEGGGFEGYTVVRNKQIDSNRWHAIYELVLWEHGTDRYYATSYEQGLTEMQDIRPFEDEGDEITFHQVWPHEVTIVKFRDNPPEG